MSPVLGSHFGISHLMAAGEKLAVFLPPHYRTKFDDNFELIKNNDGVQYMRFDLPNESMVFVECHHLPVYDDEGKLIGFKIVGRPIS